MSNTQPSQTRVDAPTKSEQYSLFKILGIWAAAAILMGLLAWVVAPAIIPHISLHRGLVHWMLMVVGMMWQFVLSLAILSHELGGLEWPSIKRRIWLNLPRDPRTGKPRKVLFLWVLAAIAGNYFSEYLVAWLDTAWTNVLGGFREPSYVRTEALADPSSRVSGGSSG